MTAIFVALCITKCIQKFNTIKKIYIEKKYSHTLAKIHEMCNNESFSYLLGFVDAPKIRHNVKRET